MRRCPVDELMRIVSELAGRELSSYHAKEIVDRYSFEKMSGRSAGEENTRSFLRKGIIGDWKNHFNLEAREKFNMYAGDQLIRLGYETDDSWVEQQAAENDM